MTPGEQHQQESFDARTITLDVAAPQPRKGGSILVDVANVID